MENCYKCHQPLNDTTIAGLHSECYCDWFDLSAYEPFTELSARTCIKTPDDIWATISFFHGKFRKYAARLGNKYYILKMQQADVAQLPAMEYLCNQIARSLGLLVPDHFFIKFENELETFVSENFMTGYPQSNLVHIYRFLEKPENFTCEGILKVLENKVKQYEDIDRFVKLCLFDALIGNHDRHGRNIGLIEHNNSWSLAPFYDNPSYLAIEEEVLLGALHEPRGSIPTKEVMEPTMRAYVKEWYRLGFKDSVKEFQERIDLKQTEQLIENSFISPKRKTAFMNLIKRRYRELHEST